LAQPFLKVVFLKGLLYMKKVLVLCQRKSGWLYAGQIDGEDIYKKIENTVAPKINELIHSLVDDVYEIEYLSSFSDEHSTGKVDIEGFLTNNKDDYLTLKEHEKILTRDFIKQNEGNYDIILLNTCPWQQMDFNLISQLLVADGLMVFTAYGASGRKVNVKRMMDIPTKFFTLADTREDEVLIYKKKLSPRKKTSSPPKRSPSVVTPPYKKGGRRLKTFKTTFKKGCAKLRKRTFKKSAAKR